MRTKHFLFISAFILGLGAGHCAHADQKAKSNEFYLVDGSKADKLSAMRKLLVTNNQAEVVRCYPVMMNEKGNVVKAKVAK